VDGLRSGKPVTLKISANRTPFREQRVLASAWAQPQSAAFSTDNIHWSQTKPAEIANRLATYRFDAPAETVWLAWGPPFVPQDAEELLARVAAQRPDAERFTLAHTRDGHPVKGIRIGGGSPQQPAPFGVWVQARQHAWEAGSSWVGRGFLEWIASDDPGAVELRRLATIYFIPIMDVDNVNRGAGGKDAMPQDQNRDWSDTPVYPEVAAAQRKLLELEKSRRLHVMVDLHNPGPTDHRPFFYGPFDLEKLSPLQQRNYGRWLELAKSAINSALRLEPAYRVSSYMTPEERVRSSRDWVQRHTASEVVVVTLETSWNTPHSTTQGYMTVGRQLAATLSSYLAEDPRRPAAPASSLK
jgi:hypothetical protein